MCISGSHKPTVTLTTLPPSLAKALLIVVVVPLASSPFLVALSRAAYIPPQPKPPNRRKGRFGCPTLSSPQSPLKRSPSFTRIITWGRGLDSVHDPDTNPPGHTHHSTATTVIHHIRRHHCIIISISIRRLGQVLPIL